MFIQNDTAILSFDGITVVISYSQEASLMQEWCTEFVKTNCTY